MPSHQQYMNTSDRWMATDHEAQGGPFHQAPAEWQTAYQPTAIDILLSEMFNYPHQPQAPQQMNGNGQQGGAYGQAPM